MICTFLTYSQFIPFFLETPDLAFFFSQAFSNRASAGIAFDLLVTAIAIMLFIYKERSSISRKKLAIVICSVFLVGVCLALPLFLYFREENKRIEN